MGILTWICQCCHMDLLIYLVDSKAGGEWLERSSKDDLQGCCEGERPGQDHSGGPRTGCQHQLIKCF